MSGCSYALANVWVVCLAVWVYPLHLNKSSQFYASMCGHTLLKISIKRYAGRQHYSYRMFVKLELFLVYILFAVEKQS